MKKVISYCDICKKETAGSDLTEEATLKSIKPIVRFTVREICITCKKIEQDHEVNRWNSV